MKQADIFKASFHALKHFFHKPCRCPPCTVSYDFLIIELNKHTYVIISWPYPYMRQTAYHSIPIFPVLELAVQDVFCFWFATDIFLQFVLYYCVIECQPFLLHNLPAPVSEYSFSAFHQLFLYFTCAVIITVGSKNFNSFRGKTRLTRLRLCFIAIRASTYL